MQSQFLSRIEIDHDQMRKEVNTVSRFNFSHVYKEFVCGELKSCILWNKRGDIRDTILANYDGAANQTDYGRKLPYINSLISSLFNLEYLKFARILVLSPNSVFMPHRDYLELKHDFLRVHIPLKTDSQCFHSEDHLVYHMNVGEVWYLDASKVHSAASFSHEHRFHLILDFAYREQWSDIMRIPAQNGSPIPSKNLISRQDVTEELMHSIYALHKLIDARNFYDVFAIIIKKYFKINIHGEVVYDWLLRVAEMSGNSEIIQKVLFLQNYCLLKR